jgi:hypothetical protein
MILPDQFHQTAPEVLLREAAFGRIGVDNRLLRVLLDSPDATLQAIDQLSRNQDPEWVADLSELYFDLHRALLSPHAVPFLMDRLQENVEEIPDELVEAFAEFGPLALDAVLDFYSSLPEESAADVAFLLAAMGVHDERVRTILRQTLARDPYEAGLSIGLLGDPALLPDVEAALATLPAAAKQEREALQDCLELLNSDAPRQVEPFDLFALYPDTGAPLFEAMAPLEVLPFLTCESAEYRAAAARSFSDDEEVDDAIVAALLERARTDESPEVRAEALRALGPCAGDPAIRSELLAVALDQQAPHEVRAGALIALAPPASDEALQPLLMAFYEHEVTRPAALEAMWRSFDARYRKYFAANLRHEDDDIARQAIQGVGLIPLPDLCLELVPMFDHPVLREEVLVSYALTLKAGITPKSVSRLFDRIEEKAGGMTEEESEAVAFALDRRLEMEGYRPFFFPPDEDDEHDHGDAPVPVEPVRTDKVGRNDPCPCGSGKKFKKCCGA